MGRTRHTRKRHTRRKHKRKRTRHRRRRGGFGLGQVPGDGGSKEAFVTLVGGKKAIIFSDFPPGFRDKAAHAAFRMGRKSRKHKRKRKSKKHKRRRRKH